MNQDECTKAFFKKLADGIRKGNEVTLLQYHPDCFYKSALFDLILKSNSEDENEKIIEIVRKLLQGRDWWVTIENGRLYIGKGKRKFYLYPEIHCKGIGLEYRLELTIQDN